MLNNIFSRKLLHISTYIVAFSFTLTPFFSSMAILLFSIASLFHIKVKNYDKQKLKIIFLLSFLFIMYLVGYFFSPNKEMALKLLIRLSPTFFIPLLIIGTDLLTDLNLSKFVNSFIIGVLTSIILTMTFVSYTYITSNTLNLFYDSLSSFLHIHPTYYSLFILTAIILILVYPTKVFIKYKLTLLIIFTTFILLLQTKIIIIITLCIYISLFFNKKIKIKNTAILISIIFLGVILGITIGKSRFTQVTNNLEMGTFKESGISQRAWLWKSALKQIKNKPFFGYGLASQKTSFVWMIEKDLLENPNLHTYDTAVKINAKKNLHNQYITILYEFGIVGFLLFIISIVLLFKQVYKNNNYLSLYLFSSYLLVLFTENLLDRQMGVYYTFILSLLFIYSLLPYDNKHIERS